MSFALSNEIIYLNHAAVSPWPVETANAVKQFAEENQRYGAANYPQWLLVEKELRSLAAWLLNAPTDESIALLKNTSEALSVVAHGLNWKSGDNIVTFDNEFPSNRIPWQSLDTRGVDLRFVDPLATSNPELALIEQCDNNTRLISVSSVQYANGFRCNLEQIGTFCRDNGILFCVDAIQSLGVIPLDVQQIHADFVMADGHKWLMGPEGIALFYCRPEILNELELHQFGWHMVENRGDYTSKTWNPAPDSSRFECGSPNMLGIHGLTASLKHIKAMGIYAIRDRVLANTRLMIDLVNANDALKLISVPDDQRLSGIITFSPKSGDIASLFQHLQQDKVICALRGGGIRFSPHYYNSQEEIEQAFRLVDNYL
jgi:selenocysteine lyase/cysteine desulfurase